MIISAYAAYSKSDDIRYNSSSGGLFSELASYIFNCGGYVAGAAFDEGFYSVSHIITNNPKDLNRLVKSKYLQSRFNIAKEAEELLKKGNPVLCCGTPCQIAGLKANLNKDYDNLITVDFVCHGTPMQKVWKKYLEWQEKLHKSSVVSVDFRSKENGWSNYLLLLLFDNGDKYAETSDKDLYMRLFLNDICLCKGCYNCKYKGDNRKSDLTIADYWGIDTVLPEFNDNKGTSLLVVNTQKGADILSKISNNLVLTETDVNEAFKLNNAAIKSATRPACYEDFLSNLDNMPFDKLAKKYLPPIPLKERLKKYGLVQKALKIKHRVTGC